MSQEESEVESQDFETQEPAEAADEQATAEGKPKHESVPLDCAGLSMAEIAHQLQELAGVPHIQLENFATDVPGFGAGIALDQTVVSAKGCVTDFAFFLNEHTSWDIHGKAGHACGHSLTSGRILIRESAGDYAGAFAVGGFMVVYGKAGNNCGHRMSGADVLIRRKVGDLAGAQMQSGVLVLCNGAGGQLGQGMTGGDIFIRGEIGSVAEGVRSQRLKDPDSMRLSLLLARSGMRGGAKEFKLYRARK